MQASRSWLPPGGTLGGILSETAARVRELTARRKELERSVAEVEAGPSLEGALRTRSVSIIAEVKRRSPSKGVIRETLSASEQAAAYCAGGAAAISVLTEGAHFGGAAEDVVSVRRAVGVPVLKKDFHVDPVQILEARALGASAALLIARALPPDALDAMLRVAALVGVETLVEVRDEEEMRRALDAGATIIGVNNRDLETLEMEMETGMRLLPKVPAGLLAVAESGIGQRGDVERMAAAGADAVLVGSTVSASADPAAAVNALVGVARRKRAS